MLENMKNICEYYCKLLSKFYKQINRVKNHQSSEYLNSNVNHEYKQESQNIEFCQSYFAELTIENSQQRKNKYIKIKSEEEIQIDNIIDKTLSLMD